MQKWAYVHRCYDSITFQEKEEQIYKGVCHLPNQVKSDVPSATQLRLRGLLKASAGPHPDLLRAQAIAEALGADGSHVSSDRVHEEFERMYERPLKIGNSMGALFSSKVWMHVGYCKSTRPASHARVIQTWQLKSRTKQYSAIEHRDSKPFLVGVADGERFCVRCSHAIEECSCKEVGNG